jgi:hypothetical protein
MVEPRPPRLHWAIVLVLSIVTLGLFMDIWLLVQAWWVRKHDRSSRALTVYVWSIVLSLLGEVLMKFDVPSPVTAGLFIVGLVLALVSTFAVRDFLAAYIRSITGKPAYLGSFLTLILGPIYLQYHMNRLAEPAAPEAKAKASRKQMGHR